MTSTIKAYKGMGMEGSVARWYERTTRKGIPEIRELAACIAAMVPAGGAVLEVAPGPGFLSIELARLGLQVQAVDISKTFVELAGNNAQTEGVPVLFEQGDAAALPVANESVDFVVCRAAFKNFTEPVKAMREMLRVVKPGGGVLLIDMRRDVSITDLQRYADGLGLSWFNRWLTMFIFRHMLIKRAYPMEEIYRMAAEAGWDNARIETTPVGFEASVMK